MDDEQLLKVEEVARRFAVSAREIWRGVADGTFPKPIKLGPKTTRWLESEILSHLQKLKEAR
jgi:prophage regulatory protein